MSIRAIAIAGTFIFSAVVWTAFYLACCFGLVIAFNWIASFFALLAMGTL